MESKRRSTTLKDIQLAPEADPEAPPCDPVAWAGWLQSNPNRVARTVAKLWYDARNDIGRELGAMSTADLQLVRVDLEPPKTLR